MTEEVGEMAGNKGVRALLHVVRVICVSLSALYFIAFNVSIYGLSVRLSTAGRFVTAIDAHTPGFLPTLHVSVTQGNCHLNFLVVFLVALIIDWLVSRRLYGTRAEHRSPRPAPRHSTARGAGTGRG